MTKKLYKSTNRADVELLGDINASQLTIPLESGGGAEFPTGTNGNTTSAGDSNTLNATGIGSTDIAVGDFIRNITDGSFAIVKSISTDSLETTNLVNGSDNTWDNNDEYVVGSFVLSVNDRDSNGVITKIELVEVKYCDNDNDTIYIETGGRGFGNTSAQSFTGGTHYASIFVSKELISGIQEILADSMVDIDELQNEDMTIYGLKTFDVLPKCSVVPSSADDVVNKQYVDDQTGGGLILSGSRSSEFMPRVLNWTDNIDSGNYVIKRQIGGGGYSTLATVAHNVNTYIDSDILSGDIDYKIEATNDEDVFTTSNILSFKNTENDLIEDGEYGDGSDGAYSGGNLNRGRVYQFTDFTLNSSMNFDGDGAGVIFVDGDLTLQSSAVMNLLGAEKGAYYDDSFDVHTNSVDTSTGHGTGGDSGAGGAGGKNTADTANGGAGGPSRTEGQNGAGGNTGQASSGAGGAGGAGGSAGEVSNNSTGGGGSGGGGGAGGSSGGDVGAVGGVGGNGADVGDLQPSVIFVVSGNIDLQSSSQINGNGVVGNAGGAGGAGGNNGGNSAGVGGGGGGGGGAGGSDGAKIFMFHEGTFTDNSTKSLTGGAGGAGGAGGNKGTADWHGLGANGSAGQSGSAGSAGSLSNTQL